MAPDIAVLIPRFRFNEKLLAIETDGFAPADWAWKPSSGGNPALWILGHVAHHRRAILRILGADLPAAAWEARYGRGAAAGAPLASNGPELAADFAASGAAIEERASRLGPADLARPFGGTLPDGADTVGGALSFLYFHETYHLGQIGYLRRLLGKPGFA